MTCNLFNKFIYKFICFAIRLKNLKDLKGLRGKYNVRTIKQQLNARNPKGKIRIRSQNKLIKSGIRVPSRLFLPLETFHPKYPKESFFLPLDISKGRKRKKKGEKGNDHFPDGKGVSGLLSDT
jgi:hypothetical protein